jgi:hypothetical protein
MGDGDYISYKNLDLAVEDLGEMIDTLDGYIKRGGIDNNGVIYLIKAWSKVNILSGLNLDSAPYWRMKRLPPPLTGKLKRSQVLSRALDDYRNTLRPGAESGDYFRRADEAMLNFVWDYRQHITDDVNRETVFVHEINRIVNEGRNGIMKEEVFKMDQSI